MAVFSSLSYPTSGLTLCLDAGNRKSFGGVGAERITNIVAAFGSWNGLVGTSSNYIGKGGRNGVYLSITNANGGGVRYWDSTNGGVACSPSTQYTITALVRYVNTPSVNLFYVRQYNSGGAQTSESGKYTTANQVAVGDGFYLAWATFTTDSTAASFLVQGYDYANNQIWVEDVQCKLGGLGNLVSSSNNGSLTGSMTFSSANGGVIQFSSGNYITTGLNYSSGAYTVIASARYTAVGGRIITANSNNWLMGHWGNQTENHYAEGWVSASPSGASDTNWRILAASGNTSNDSWQMYVNGVQTYSNNGGAAGPNNLGINCNSNEYASGQVGFLLAYDRVLSASEVRQVFEANRSNYGL